MVTFDAIVLGIGGIGSAALYELANRGIRAVGIDRFQPPHDHGSTHGHTRVIRQAYFEHPNYVPLLLESYRLWRELEGRTGRQLYHETGLVEIGPPDGIVVPGTLIAAAKHSLSVERLSAAEVADAWPALRLSKGMEGVFERHAGYLLVEDCVRSHLDAARAAGAEILTNTEVYSYDADNRGVHVETSQGSFSAGRLIIAAGPWASPILNASATANSALKNIRLAVRRKSLFWFQCDAPEYEATSGMPVFLFELRSGVYYGFPKLDVRGVKVAEHSGGLSIEDPLLVDRAIDIQEQQRLIGFLAAHLPGVSHQVLDHAVCLYTMSPDEHFIIDHAPDHRNVVFVAGLSGHGFKFAPVLGAALADLAINGKSALPIDFLSADRFKRCEHYN